MKTLKSPPFFQSYMPFKTLALIQQALPAIAFIAIGSLAASASAETMVLA